MTKKEDEAPKKKSQKKEAPQVKEEPFQLTHENRYLVTAFKASKYYREGMTNKELRESFIKYKQK